MAPKENITHCDLHLDAHCICANKPTSIRICTGDKMKTLFAMYMRNGKAEIVGRTRRICVCVCVRCVYCVPVCTHCYATDSDSDSVLIVYAFASDKMLYFVKISQGLCQTVLQSDISNTALCFCFVHFTHLDFVK